LAATLDSLLKPLFGNRILPFDQDAALAYAALFAKARSRGVAISTGYAQIAAIAEIHGFAVATRDIAPFEAAGSRVVDPWKA
jgi:predicted nucleic acid-binding protein